MSNLDAGTSIRRARLRTTGRKTTTTGVLLMKAEITATTRIIGGRIKMSGILGSLARSAATESIAPHFSSAALRINIAATAIGPAFENTAIASFGVSSPSTKSRAKALIADSSVGIFSQIKAASSTTSNKRVKAISQVMAKGSSQWGLFLRALIHSRRSGPCGRQ